MNEQERWTDEDWSRVNAALDRLNPIRVDVYRGVMQHAVWTGPAPKRSLRQQIADLVNYSLVHVEDVTGIADVETLNIANLPPSIDEG